MMIKINIYYIIKYFLCVISFSFSIKLFSIHYLYGIGSLIYSIIVSILWTAYDVDKFFMTFIDKRRCEKCDCFLMGKNVCWSCREIN